MSPSEMIGQNLRHTMECFAHATPGCEIREFGGVRIASAAVDASVFNTAFLSEPVHEDPVELDRRVAVAKVYFDSRGLNWSFWVSESSLDLSIRRRAAGIFGARGLPASTECTGMMADSLTPVRRRVPSLQFQKVDDAESRLAFCHITSVCFRIPFATSIAIYNNPITWETDFTAHVAYLDGKPVGTAATVDAAGAIGLYCVATLPEFQRRGIGESLTRHALGAARDSADTRPMILQATGQVSALYHRIGFRDAGKIRIYVARPR